MEKRLWRDCLRKKTRKSIILTWKDILIDVVWRNPESTLLSLTGTVVIDEVQRIPELFETLRVVIDSPNCVSRFLLLGSVSPTLIKGVSESLAGRCRHCRFERIYNGRSSKNQLADALVQGVDFQEVCWQMTMKLQSIGVENFITTFLERDIPQYGITIPSETLRRFWIMLAHYHGQIWNAAEFARAIGRSESTVRSYLDILSSAYVVRILRPVA